MNHSTTCAVSLVLLIAVWGAAAFAMVQKGSLTVGEAFAMELEDLMSVDITTGTRRSLVEAPGVATVLTADTIAAIGATDLDQVLESVPGLHISYSSTYHKPLYILRGLTSSVSPYVLFLINGVPINQFVGGGLGVVWGGMPVDHISRIEVVRGPGSALSGADAVGGVIHIITKSPEEVAGTEVGVRFGSFDTRSAWLLHGGRSLGLDISVALQFETTAGHRERVEADAQTGLDRIFGTAASLAPGPVHVGGERVDLHFDAARKDWRLRLGYQGRFDIGTGAGTTRALDPAGESDRRRYHADLTWEREDAFPDWDVTAQASFLINREFSEVFLLPPGSMRGTTLLPEGWRVGFGQTEEQTRFAASATYNGAPGHRLHLGIGRRNFNVDDFRSLTNLGSNSETNPDGFQDISDDPDRIFGLPQKRSVSFLFAQDEWRLADDWDLIWGLRWDEFSDFGATINPRLALIWKISDRWTSKLLYGRAFRPPIYGEQYLINNPQLLGNRDLAPEISNTLELAFHYHLAGGSGLSGNVFTYRLEDLILPVGPLPGIYQNVGELSGYGLELEGRWRFGEHLEIIANYAYQRSADVEAGEMTGRAPGHQVYLRVGGHLRTRWRWGTVFHVVADRERPPGDPREDVEDIAQVDISLRRIRLWGRHELGIVVRNLFDADAREPSVFAPGPAEAFIPGDLPLAGRSVSVELRYRPR